MASRIKKVRLSALDALVVSVGVGVLIYMLYRIKTGLHYRWNWGTMPQYLFRFDAEAGKWVPNLLIQGLLMTIRLSIWGTILATLIGTIMGFLRLSKGLFHRLIGGFYVELNRNVPPLVLVFIFYFFINSQIMALLGVERFVLSMSGEMQMICSFLFAPPGQLIPFFSALLTLAIFEGAYITEIIRAGIQSLERGQWEAARALGLSWWQQMRYIILPQAIRRILPPLAGQFISTLKDSAIVSVISIQELTFQGMELMAATYLTFEVWITVAFLYFVVALILSLGVERLEIFMRRSDA